MDKQFEVPPDFFDRCEAFKKYMLLFLHSTYPGMLIGLFTPIDMEKVVETKEDKDAMFNLHQNLYDDGSIQLALILHSNDEAQLESALKLSREVAIETFGVSEIDGIVLGNGQISEIYPQNYEQDGVVYDLCGALIFFFRSNDLED